MLDKTNLRAVKDRPRKDRPEVWRYYDEYGEMQGRTCVKCGEDKPVSEFPSLPKTAYGCGPRCKPCKREDSKIRTALKNLEKMERIAGPRADRNVL